MRTLLLALVLPALLALPVSAQETPDLEGVKCVMQCDNDVNAEKSIEYMDAKLYFCCDECMAEFQDAPESHAAMANHQLFVTGQYVQKACPITGKELADGVTAEVGSKEVGLCCAKCQAKVNDAEDLAAKAELVFNKKAFEKGFEPAESEDNLTGVQCIMMDMKVSPDNFLEHQDGKLYFCCKRCMAKYNDDPDAYAAKANRQLVETGQYTQTACPFSGHPVADSVSATIGETEVGFCCAKCQAKVEGADDDDARTDMVFSNQSFEKGFEKSNR